MTRILAILAPLSYPIILICIVLSVACGTRPAQSTTVYPAQESRTEWRDYCNCEVTITVTEATLTEVK